MRKLIIFASSLALACVANAASATWGFGSDSILDRNGAYVGDPTVATAFLYLGTVTTTATTYDLAGTTFLAYSSQDPTTYQFGPVDTPVVLGSLSSDAANQAYTLILAEGNLTSLDGYSGYMIVASGNGGQGVDPMTGDTWATFTDATAYGAGAWQNLSSVPEPTSGLLMLLGMAGLALRRRRV